MNRKFPVVIAGTNCLSGVTTWADQLRAAFKNNPDYEIRLLHIGRKRPAGFDMYASSVEVARELAQEMAPVVVVPNYVWELYSSGFAPGVHCVGICHADSDEQYYCPLSWYEPLISKFIAVSPECGERLKQRLPFRAEDITTLPYGISVPHVLHRGYQTEPLRIVYAGRVTQPQKRVWDFVPLVEQLLAARVRFVFEIVGAGDEFRPLREAMCARFPEGCVRFHARKPHQQMHAVWSASDVFVQVSDFEGTSVSMLEAMAHGVIPVVTAASSGISGVIDNEVNGFVLPIGDAAAMARVVAQLAANPSMLATIGHAAHRTAQAFSIEHYAEEFSRFLDHVLDAGWALDVGKRYGRYAPAHPLLQQQNLIVRQQEQISRLQQGRFKRLFQVTSFRLRRAKMRRSLPSPHASNLDK